MQLRFVRATFQCCFFLLLVEVIIITLLSIFWKSLENRFIFSYCLIHVLFFSAQISPSQPWPFRKSGRERSIFLFLLCTTPTTFSSKNDHQTKKTYFILSLCSHFTKTFGSQHLYHWCWFLCLPLHSTILVHMDTKIRMAKGRHKTSVSSIACGLHGVVCFSKVLKPSPEAYQVLRSKTNKSIRN